MDEKKRQKVTGGGKKNFERPEGELPGMPKLDKIGQAGLKFLESVKAMEKAQKECGDAKDNLIRAMKTAKRYMLQLNGYKFEYVHSGPKDNIKIQKPK